MKKLLFILGISIFASNINAQVTQDPKMYNRADDLELGMHYKKKGNNQQIAGWATLGGGLALVLLSGTVAYDLETAGVMALVGSIATVASVPLFIAGAKNKGRAEILLRSSNVPLSFDPGKNIPVKSVGIGIKISK
jgi:hypothetical protein